MKQFLRYLFVVAAMLMVVVGDAWSECYLINESQIRIAYSNNNANESGTYSGTYALDGPCYMMSFSYRLDANSDATYWHKFTIEGRKNGGEWTEIYDSGEIKNAGSKSVSKDMSAYANTIDEIRFKRTARKGWTSASAGTKDVLINNFQITRQESMSATPNPLPFSLTAIGETSDTKQIVVDYSNIGVTQVVSSTNTTDFTVTPKQDGYNNCFGTATYDVVFHPRGITGGDRSTTVTIAGRESGSNSDKKSVTITVNGRAKGFPEHTWNGSTEYYVDESIELSGLWWTSNSENAPSYAIENFVAEDETGVTPSINSDGKSIKLTRAGKLTVKIIQDASETYSALSTIQEITIKKYPSNFQWNLGDPLDCYVDDSCEESVLFSRSSDLPMLITSDNEGSVVYSDGKFTAVGTGVAVITVMQDKHYKWTDFTSTYTIRVNKYDMSASLEKSDAVLNELISNAIKVSHGLQDYQVESKNPGIAEYMAGNKIQTYYTEGTAQFRVTRAEDRKYKKLDVTLNLNVKKSGDGCLVLDAPVEYSFTCSLVGTDQEYVPAEFNGVPNQLTFEAETNNNDRVGNVEVQEYVNGWQKIAEINPNEGYDGYGPYDLSENATKIRFFNTYGSRQRHFRNVQVTRKTYLRPTVNSLTLPQATISKPVSASFNLSWSTCSDEIKVVCDNDKFKLNVGKITPSSNRYGTTTITATYDANSGSQSGTIIIYDQSQKIEIPVSCEVKSKLATEIVYTGDAQYNEIVEGIPYPFYVKDENGNTVTGATITLETSNEDILSFDENKIYPHCGGNVTLTANYAGDATHEPATLEKIITIADCNQQIIWDQDFRTYLATEDGSIAETTVLEAYAIPTGTPITYTLDEAAAKFAEIRYNTENGTYSLYVHGVGKGFITASVNACNFEDEQYLAAEVIREIRVHKEGDPCDSYSIDDWNEYNITLTNSTKVLNLSGLPETTMTFWAHAQEGSISNELKVDFSKDGNNWEGQQEFSLKASSFNTQYTCNTVVEGAKYVRFRTGSTLKSFFHGICIRQKTYLTPSVNTILIENAIVNQPFTYSFTVDYSDVPLIQHSVTNDNNLGLTITPANEDIHNVCGEYGSYTFTLTGTSLYPQTNVTETLTITTPVGHEIKIPITITSSLLDTYYFNQQNGDWSDLNNWQVNDAVPSSLPTASNPVVVTKKVTIDNQAVAYGVEVQNGGYVNIASSGGLTVHAGGYTSNNQEEDLEITIDKTSAGYFRMYPKSVQARTLADMPQAKVNFTTRGNMNDGGNKDAAWQYIGAPGSGVGMDLAHTTVLYLRSEEKGWVRQYTEWAQLTPFAGYALSQKEQETFTLYPQLLNADQTIQLTYTEEGMRGDNLWANSYMAPLDITKFSQEDFTGNVDRTFYLYNSGSWNDWNKDQSATNDANVYTPGRYYAINLAQIDATKDQTVIPSMQGVYMTAGEGGGTLTINYEKHVWNNSQTGKMNTPLRIAPHSEENQSADFLRIRLQVNSENSGADRMYVIQDSLATSGYDNGYDAPKQMATGLMNIYTNEPFGKMEISSTDHMDGMYIGFEAGEDSEYAMTFTSLLGDSLYLYDSQQDLIIEMVNNEQYHFIAEPYSVNDFRFQIMVAPELSEEDNNNQGGVTTNVDNISTPSVWVNQGKLYVTNSQENSTITIYTASGMLVAAPYTIKHTPCTINIAHLPAGVYVLRLNDQAYKFICE